VNVCDGVEVTVGVLDGGGVSDGVRVSVGVSVIVGVLVIVGVSVGVLVFVGVEVRVGVAVGLAEMFPPPKSSTTAPLTFEYHKPMYPPPVYGDHAVTLTVPSNDPFLYTSTSPFAFARAPS
jgi:hypothetical protein